MSRRRKNQKPLEFVIEHPPERRGNRDTIKVLAILDTIAKDQSDNRQESDTEANEP